VDFLWGIRQRKPRLTENKKRTHNKTHPSGWIFIGNPAAQAKTNRKQEVSS